MFRAGASRPAFRALGGLGASYNASRVTSQFSSKLSTLSRTRPQAVCRPLALASARYATRYENRYETQQPPMDKINTEHEAKVSQEKLAADPDNVSTTSSTHPVFGEIGLKDDKEKDADMMAGVKQDLVNRPWTSRLELPANLGVENHPRYLLPRSRPQRSHYPWYGRCASLPRHLALHRLLRLGDQPRYCHR